MSSESTTDRDRFFSDLYAVVAALGCLPAWSFGVNGRATIADQLPEIPRRQRSDSTSMLALDAIASVCVAKPEDAYAVTHEISKSEYILFIASSSGRAIPTTVIRHLEHIWAFMKSLGGQHDSALTRDSRKRTPALRALHARLVDDLYRFSWVALRHRFALTADVAIQALLKTLDSEHQETETTTASECSSQASECNDFHGLLSLLTTLRRLVLDEGLDDTPPLKLHIHLLELRRILERDYVSSMLQRIDDPDVAALEQDISALVWLCQPVEFLLAFAHADEFATVSNLTLRVVPIEPFTRPFVVSDDYSQLRRHAETVYTDGKVPEAGPEPNFKPDFAAVVREPLEELCLSREHTVEEDVPVHAECSLLAHFITRDKQPYIAYIATSEPSCLPCWHLFKAYNTVYPFTYLRMWLRSSSGHVPRAWVLPHLSQLEMRAIFRPNLAFLHKVFRQAMSAVRKRRAEQRRAERVARGEDPLTDAERQYNTRVANIQKQFDVLFPGGF